MSTPSQLCFPSATASDISRQVEESVVPTTGFEQLLGPTNDVTFVGQIGPVDEFQNEMTNVGLRISIVVATYNRLEGLQNLLVELCAQDCETNTFEVVVVDDESRTAVTLDVAETALAQQQNRILPFGFRLYRRTNGGPGVARDTGIVKSRGEVIVILDDDMHIGPGFLRAHQQLHRSGATVVLGNIQTPRDATLALFERFHMNTLDKFVAAVGRGEPVVEGARLCTGNVSFRKEAYQQVGGFDANLRRCEDRDLGIRFELAGEKIVFGAAAISEHHSDHSDAETWRKRNRLYGELDTKIAGKHPQLAKVSPWAFLAQLPKAATPVGVLSALFPQLGTRGALVAYRAAQWFDSRSKTAAAVKLTGLSYGLEYYAGVGIAHGSPRGALGVLRSYRSFQKLPQRSAPRIETASAQQRKDNL